VEERAGEEVLSNRHKNPLAPCRRSWLAFALAELLTVLGIVAVLAGLLFPALIRSKQSAHRIRCTGNLRQLGLACQLYWDDNDNRAFRYSGPSTNGGDIFWFGWLARGLEGKRQLDLTRGPLYPYLQGRGVELCPILAYRSDRFKLKATGAAFGYGYNLCLSAPPTALPVNLGLLSAPASTALLGDTAQVNTFQFPASVKNPMLEEFYYMSTNEPTVHFRHFVQANVLFCDGHIQLYRPVPASLDRRLKGETIGRLDTDLLSIK